MQCAPAAYSNGDLVYENITLYVLPPFMTLTSPSLHKKIFDFGKNILISEFIGTVIDM